MISKEFKDNLLELRRSRGMSQETLADQIGVSRQAVSKWETGDAMPDLLKLIALAEALDVSIDALCGRPVPESTEAPSAQPSEPARGSRRLRTVLAVVLGVLLLAGGFWAGTRFAPAGTAEPPAPADSSAEPTAAALPDTVTASPVALGFSDDGKSLICTFIPSVVSEDCRYQVSYTASGKTGVVEAKCVSGVCTAVLPLKQYVSYTLSAVIQRGSDARSVLLATSVYVYERSISWLPAE